MRQNVLGILLVALLLASGCAQKPTAKSSQAPAEAVKVDAAGAIDSDETGEIAGRVLDDEFRPLEAASVGLQGTDARTKTTQDGIFYFSAVPARAYTLVVEKFGFEPKSQSVLVSARQRALVQVVLVQVANTESFVDDGFTFRGQINCSARANVSGTNSNPECGQVNAETDVQRMRYFDMLPGVNYILFEASWQPTVPTVNSKLTLAVRVVETESWRQIQGESPIKTMVTPADFAAMTEKYQKNLTKNGGQIQLMMFPGEAVNQGGVGAGSTLQQSFTVYGTAWYRMEPPAGYSRLPSD